MADVEPALQLHGPLSIDTLDARTLLLEKGGAPLVEFRQGDLEIAVRERGGFVWVTLGREAGGGLALRLPVFSERSRCRVRRQSGATAVIDVASALGAGRIVLTGEPFGLEQLRLTMSFTAAEELVL